MSYKWSLRYAVCRILRPRNRYSLVRKAKRDSSVLDVGCGNNSPYMLKSMFPGIIYTGIDVGDYNQAKPILADHYILCKPDEFSAKIAALENRFDVVISSHNIEHCNEPDTTLDSMLNAVSPGGYIYIAFPCAESTRFPSRTGTLNYYDDCTHKSVPPSFDRIVQAIKKRGFTIEFQSRRYRPLLLCLLGLILEPLSAIRSRVYLGTWELYGFTSLVLAKKPPLTT